MKRFSGLISALLLCAWLVACGGGSGSSTDSNTTTGTPTPTTSSTAATPTPTSSITPTPTTPAASGNVTVHMLGDSTMTYYTSDRRPQMGWGEAVPQFFNSNVTVKNWALGGRSSRSFYYESTRWPTIKPQIAAGDYVIIQFAHNDQKSGADYATYGTYAYCSDGSTDGEACTGKSDVVDSTVDIAEHSYYQWLKKYVLETRAQGGIPILMSPIVRKYFSGSTITSTGQHNLTTVSGTEANPRGDYVAAMKAVATKYNVPFVDITAETKKIVESYGDAAATANLYISADSTHPQVLFANLIAKRALEGLKNLNILSGYMVPVTSLIASPSTLDWSTRYLNMASTKSITVSAFDLTPAAGTVTVSAPANFELSLDKTTWSQSVNLDYTNSAFTSTIYVRFTATEVRAYSGNITFAIGSTALSSTVAVSGTGIASTGGVASYASWFTAGTAVAPVTDGLVTALDATVSTLTATTSKVIAVDGQDTTVARFAANTSTTRDNNQYLQFAVAPSTGSFTVDTISGYLTTSGGSTVVADVEYSLNADFSSATKLNATTLSFTKDTFTAKTEFSVAIVVPAGKTLYIRVYAWNTAGTAGKSLAIYGMKASGNATASGRKKK